MNYRVAVVGATGNVGREMLNVLAERNFPVAELVPLASSRSIGVEMSFGDKRVKVKDLETFDFSGMDFVLMSAGSEPSPVAVLSVAPSAASVVVGEEVTGWGENRYQSKFDTHCCPAGAWKTKVALPADSSTSGSVMSA